MDGFSFCGVHCSAFGIGFVPSPARRMQSTPSFKPIEETVTQKHGGYWYGNQVDIREFALECYFEEIDIETYEGMIQWLHRDQEGQLIFDDRPFVYYTARLAKVVEGKIYTTTHPCNGSIETLYSGSMTITFHAHDPFGKMSYVSYDKYDLDGAAKRCGILPSSQMPEAIQASTGDYLIYNPGTEMADTVIRIGGTAPNGVTIENATTGDKCILITLPPAPDYIELDSEAGSVQQLPSSPNSFAFEYHEEGYIRLAPCTPYFRDIFVEYTDGSNIVTVHGFDLTKDFVGRYMRLGESWYRIISVQDSSHAIINQFMNETGTDKTIIAVMNQIHVSGTGAELTKLEIDYIPRLR